MNKPRQIQRRRVLGSLLGAGILATIPPLARAADPIRLGISAEFGMEGSHTAQSIEKGILLAIDEINAAGGVLGRPLALVRRDDRGLPARGVDNLIELAAMPDLVGVFCGRFSPVALEQAPLANRLGVLLLDPWAAADGIVRQPAPNYVFRLSANDTWAMETLIDEARRRRLERLAMLLPNTGWGRSSEAAALNHGKRHGRLRLSSYWYNWGDTDFTERLLQIGAEGAQALVMVANEAEGAFIVRQMAALPSAKRLPIVSHWGIAGGDFAKAAGAAMKDVDLVVVQTFSFSGNTDARARAIAGAVERKFGHPVSRLRGQVGFAHAYDMTHLVTSAIRKAGSTKREAIRDAMENLGSHDGLVRRYHKPFSATDHEALDREQLFVARFDADGNLMPVQRGR